MDAHPRTPLELFQGNRHYEIPAFQRPYVWNEEDQWAPLWDDVVRVAETYIRWRAQGSEESPRHFLGAVVYESKKAIAGDVTRHQVIDGQQRMTTLQLLLDAAEGVLADRSHEVYADSLDALVRNRAKAFAGKNEQFKLWPSQTDRAAFVSAMDPHPDGAVTHRIVDAHRFFSHEIARWVAGDEDESGERPPGTEVLRVEALSETLQNFLTLVAIDLSGHDDAQLIFETLNDRGTPLLKADLIKNWVFHRGQGIGADVDRWSVQLWADFDDPWWREELTQGRQVRSRIDIFLQYWLTMRRQVEVKTDLVFKSFVDLAAPQMTSVTEAEVFLREFRRDADTYRNFAQLDASTPEGRFHSRVIEAMEQAATTPLFLQLLSENHRVPREQVEIGLEAVESWVIRRALLRMTTKDVNKFVVAIIRHVHGAEPSEAGDRIRRFLADQTADARLWPTDEQLVTELPGIRIYGNVKQSRLRVILGAIEQYLQASTARTEPLPLPAGLQVEHVMPRGWRTHWDTGLGPQEAATRDRLIHTIGNLTLLTRSLNGALSNRPWTDTEASGLTEGGEEGTGKRSLISTFSLLLLNKSILQHSDGWTDEDIRTRSGRLAEMMCQVWPGPPEA